MLFNLGDHLGHHGIYQMTLALNIKNVRPFFCFGWTGINSSQAYALLLKGAQQTQQSTGTIARRNQQGTLVITTGRHTLSAQNQESSGVATAVLNGACKRHEAVLLQCQLPCNCCYALLTSRSPSGLTITRNRFPGHLGQVTIKPLATLTQRLFMTNHKPHIVKRNIAD